MKKKFFAKLALCLALILVLTSCAGNAPQLLDFLGNMASDIDFGGMEFRVLSHADAGEGLDFIAEDESPSNRKDAFIARLAEIEKTYNCDIICDGDEDRNYATYYISGIPRADFYQSRFKIAY